MPCLIHDPIAQIRLPHHDDDPQSPGITDEMLRLDGLVLVLDGYESAEDFLAWQESPHRSPEYYSLGGYDWDSRWLRLLPFSLPVERQEVLSVLDHGLFQDESSWFLIRKGQVEHFAVQTGHDVPDLVLEWQGLNTSGSPDRGG